MRNSAAYVRTFAGRPRETGESPTEITMNESRSTLRRTAAIIAAALFAIPSLTGCSPSKLAVGAMVPILENTKTVAFASNDMRTFNAATPSNLFLLEGLIKTEPGNRDLRVTASMLYFSYAFTFDDPADADYATMLYRKGYGARAGGALPEQEDGGRVGQALR